MSTALPPTTPARAGEQALPQLIRLGREICNDLEQAERREWWLANGLGAYAAGTVAGTLTRRYHGLLIAPLRPPLKRALVFAKADATLTIGQVAIPLHSNRWTGGAIEPRGYLNLESFHLDGSLPVWKYAFGGLHLETRIWMEPGANTTYLAWRLISDHAPADLPRLTLRLLVNARDHHGHTLAHAFSPANSLSDDELVVSLPGDTVLRFRSRCGRFKPDETWIERFDLPLERSRGLPDQDNHLCAGELELPLHPNEWVGLAASLEEQPSPYLSEALGRRRQHDASLLRLAKVQNSCLADAPAWIDQVILASDSFIVERPLPGGKKGFSVIAGYPWFGDWGRDTFISLPGLTLATHRHELALGILESWADYLEGGLLPNRFPEEDAPPEYNAADASLWYIEAWRAYVEASDDHAALARTYPRLCEIVDAYVSGTRNGIGMDATDGLIRAGNAGTQLTWMDARADGLPVTSRAGKPVEINALWHNALTAMAMFAVTLGKNPERFETLAQKARASFKRFVRPDGEGLYDVLDTPAGDDAQVRPNQILAVSLPFSPLDADAQTKTVRTVGKLLATSCGLRSLSPEDPDYRPRYEGDVRARDAAYHQGPAWGWLLPHYALALYRTNGDATHALSLLEPLADHLTDAGLGTISELFDAEPPHAPRGAPSQAWSLACALQAWCKLELARQSEKARAPRWKTNC